VLKAFGKHILGGPKRRWGNNIKCYVKQMGCELKISRGHQLNLNKVIFLEFKILFKYKVAYVLKIM
jgi:hypothetical protein